MMPPLVSILIPAHNAGQWIEATLASALAQTHPRCEIIVINDGSRDDTERRARAVAAAAPPDHIRVFDQTNAGAAAARNHALRHARGDFIQYLDADDLLAPDKIERQLARLASAPPQTLASGKWGRFTDDPANTRWEDEAVYRARDGVEFLQLHHETGSMMQPGAWLCPRALIDAAGPWDESLSLNDDGEFFARVMLAASGLIHVPEARCFYRAGYAPSLSRRRDARALASLHRSVASTLNHWLAQDRSPRTLAAANLAWRRTALELYPEAVPLANAARRSARAYGTSDEPYGAPRWVGATARLIGWTTARRFQLLRQRLP